MITKISPVSSQYVKQGYNSTIKPKENLAKTKPCSNINNLKNNCNYISFESLRIRPAFYPLDYISRYVTSDVVQNAIETNPNIRYILQTNGLKPEIQEENIDSRLQGHLFATYENAKKVGKNMQFDEDLKIKLQKAALIHDIGKALIPKEIIQKPGILTPHEREIVDLHSVLGYEILTTTDIDPDIADAVLHHHTPVYVKCGSDIAHALQAADIYSALRESRPYKRQLDKKEALEIMKEMEDKVAPDYLSAL